MKRLHAWYSGALATAALLALAGADPLTADVASRQTASPPVHAPAADPDAEELKSPRLRISYEEFKQLHQTGDLVVIDVRDAASYRAGHIPDAVSMPLATLQEHAKRLRDERRPVVTYCT